MNNFKYSGNELKLFSYAKNWKKYWTSRITPYIGETVLEVGAGTGSNTYLLWRKHYKRWLCLEPDTQLAENLSIFLKKQLYTSNYEIINGTIHNLSHHDLFDTILYIDVLEHIENDRAELDKIKKHLKVNGILIILAPAHQWLFSSFDKGIGHYRRYNRRVLRKLMPYGFEELKMEYLDSIGICVSLGNSIFLKKDDPTHKQIMIWDSFIIPISKYIDAFTFHHIGKSILTVWRKNERIS